MQENILNDFVEKKNDKMFFQTGGRLLFPISINVGDGIDIGIVRYLTPYSFRLFDLIFVSHRVFL